MRNNVGFFVIPLSLAMALSASAEVPDGWKSETLTSGATVYTPTNLQANETYRVIVYPAMSDGGKEVVDWLQEVAKKDGDNPADATAPKVESNRPGIAVVSRQFQKPDGAQMATIYTAAAIGEGKVRVVRVMMSLRTPLYNRYKESTTQIVQSATRRPTGTAVASASGGLKGRISKGGKLQPGIYIGSKYHDKELFQKMRVHLYANGEYRLCDENDKEFEYGTGTIKYDTTSGKLNIGSHKDLDNSRYEPDRDFCYYGKDEAGKPFIYAENDHGVAIYRTVLLYAGPTKRPSPEAEEVAKANAEAEAKRYKNVVPPGQGISNGQIAAILHDYKVEVYSGGMSGIGTNVTDDAYLLLKDGTIYSGLPVPPDQMDIARSRRAEPTKWGRWRREGAKYLASFPGKPGNVPLRGEPVLPGKAGTRLEGRWGTGSSSADVWGSSYALWGVTFTRGGRFRKDGRGGTANSTFIQQGGQAAINSAYDDNGSYTSVTGGNFALGTEHKKKPNGDKEGTYSIEGYTMTLRYDNGKVVRLPFFFSNRSQETLWFEGHQLALDTDKD